MSRNYPKGYLSVTELISRHYTGGSKFNMEIPAIRYATHGGSITHKLIEEYCQEGMLLTTVEEVVKGMEKEEKYKEELQDYGGYFENGSIARAKECFSVFVKLAESGKLPFNLNQLKNEVKYVDDECRVGGTIDGIIQGKDSGTVSLLDWKTGKQISEENILQGAGYAWLAKKIAKLQVREYYIVQLNPQENGVYKVKLDEVMPVWEKLVAIHNARKDVKNAITKNS